MPPPISGIPQFGAATGAPNTGLGGGAGLFNALGGPLPKVPGNLVPYANGLSPEGEIPAKPAQVNGSGSPSTPVNNSPIVSTTGVSNEYDDLSNQLDQLQQGNAQYASAFQDQIAREQASNEAINQQAISSATAKTANAENINNNQEAASLYGIRAAAAANGQSRYAPAQTALQTTAAQNSFTFKYNQLDQQEKLAIASANAAKTTGDVKTLGEMVNFIKDAQAQKLDLYKTAIQQSQYENTFNNLSANQQATLGLGYQRLNLGQAQLNLAGGIDAPTTNTQTTADRVLNSVFGGNLFGSTSVKTPAGSSSGAPVFVQGSDGLYYQQQ